MTLEWLLRRILGIIPVLILTWTLVFVAMHLIPGDPVSLILGGTPASQEVMDAERHRLGLDRPVLVQFVDFMRRAATGDFGLSFTTRQPVIRMIGEQLPYTLSLAGGGLLLGGIFGTLLGTLAGLRPNGWADALVMTAALAGLSLPSFWIGMVLIHVFGNMLGWVPIVGTPLVGDSVCCGSSCGAEPDVSIVVGRGSGIGGTFNRSAGMSGGASGGCPLISSGPFALPTRVAQPPLPRVAPTQSG